MDCFIKKVWNNNIDEKTHRQFVRFGKGKFENRALLSLSVIKDKVRLSGSFEYANDFALFVANLGDFKFEGIVLSKIEIGNLDGRKKGEIYEYKFSGKSEEIKKIYEKSYYLLLDVNEEGMRLKTKKRLPKPTKNKEAKIDDKFCVIECSIKFLDLIMDCFFWDVIDGKKIKVSHDYEINEIIMPENESDFEKIRIMAKRKGKIKRKVIVDGKEILREKEFIA